MASSRVAIGMKVRLCLDLMGSWFCHIWLPLSSGWRTEISLTCMWADPARLASGPEKTGRRRTGSGREGWKRDENCHLLFIVICSWIYIYEYKNSRYSPSFMCQLQNTFHVHLLRFTNHKRIRIISRWQGHDGCKKLFAFLIEKANSSDWFKFN